MIINNETFKDHEKHKGIAVTLKFTVKLTRTKCWTLWVKLDIEITGSTTVLFVVYSPMGRQVMCVWNRQ